MSVSYKWIKWGVRCWIGLGGYEAIIVTSPDEFGGVHVIGKSCGAIIQYVHADDLTPKDN